MEYKPGDFVTRRSYNSDVVFRIVKISGTIAVLRSYRIRLMADAPLDDLVPYQINDHRKLKKDLLMESYDFLQRQQKNLVLSAKQVRKSEINSSLKIAYQEHLVRVLHFDGDKDYLELSLANYQNLNINVKGFFIPEKGQPELISQYVKKYRPDILVITGHDGELNNRDYHSSDYFVRSVEIARSIQPDLDSLVIFAGACQSDYERIMESGANYASSPENKLIHFLDPILIVEKIAFTSVREIIPVRDIIKNTITGEGGIGGIETRGKLRLKYP